MDKKLDKNALPLIAGGDTPRLDRRSIVALLTAGAAGEIFVGSSAKAQAQTVTPKEIAVVGGGMAGTSAAKYLKMWGDEGGNPVNVTLIVATATYTSCIMSNKVLTGEMPLTSLVYNYDKLKARGVTVVVGEVASVTPGSRTVTLGGTAEFPEGGQTKNFDRVVLAPGIDFSYKSFDVASGTSLDIGFTGMTVAQAPDLLPHAWKAGPTTTALRNQLVGLTNGNKVIITIPKAPYRCPPGPYERVCVIADWIKRNRPKSKVIVLDENANVLVEPLSFGNALAKTYATYVEYYPNASIKSVKWTSAKSKTVTLRVGAKKTNALTKAIINNTAVTTFTAEIVNLIPQQKGGKIVIDTFGAVTGGLDASGKWAVIDERSYEAKAAVLAGIHVVGDSISSAQPKAGHIGNQEAKVCADAILRLESDTVRPVYAEPVTNSACYTPISSTLATWLTAAFRYDLTSNKMALVTPPGVVEPAGGVATTTAHGQMKKWFAALMEDTFG